MELSETHLSSPIHFRFYADFDVEADIRKARNLSPQQSALLYSILSSPDAMRAIARMSLLTDLSDLPGPHFNDLFHGPSDPEILDSGVVLSS